MACWTPPEPAKAKKPAAKKLDKHDAFDPYAESANTAFDVDVRDFRNVHLVANAVLMYLAESRECLWSPDAYAALLKAAQSPTLASVQALLKVSSPAQMHMTQRVVVMCNALANAAADPDSARKALAKVVGPVLLRVPGSSPEHSMTTAVLRSDAVYVLLAHEKELFPAAYVGSPLRMAQALHYTPHVLRTNEWQILTEGGQAQVFNAGAQVIEENAPTNTVYRVLDGSLSVFVGKTKVATLVAGDVFGEMALIGNRWSKAHVVADKKCSVMCIPDVALDAVLLARRDLSVAFYSVLAFELASRLNVALIQSTRALADPENAAVDPTLGLHAVRAAQPARPINDKESKFMYNAETHAVRAYFGERVPKKTSKKPHPGMMYVFTTNVTSLYSKGHSEKKSVVPFAAITDIKAEVAGTQLVLHYTEGKKAKTLQHNFRDAASLTSFQSVLASMRSAAQGQSSVPTPKVHMVKAVALFSRASTDPQLLSLEQGERFTLLDSVGGWYYGFSDADPQRKGLIPQNHVELRPHGVGLPGTMTAHDWEGLNDSFLHHDLVKGQVLLAEGDAVAVGHLYFVANGELCLQRKRDNNVVDSIGSMRDGDTMGELTFLLGGRPRGSLVVTSETAQVEQLTRERLTLLLKNEEFAARFWKTMCVTLGSRLANLQLRLMTSVPPLPERVVFEVPEEQKARAATIGSLPSMSDLPPPPPSPHATAASELKERIKRQGFFLGVDTPSEVEVRAGEAHGE